MKKSKFVIRFDIRVATPKGCVWLGHFRGGGRKILGSAIEKEVGLHVDEAHCLLGHPGGEHNNSKGIRFYVKEREDAPI